MTTAHTIGLDLGLPSDSSALVVVSTEWEGPRALHAVRHAVRFPPGTAYSVIRAAVDALRPSLREAQLVLDATGIGSPIADTFPEARAVTLTAGASEQLPFGARKVPRADVAARAALALQEGRLRIARALPLAAELARELAAFKPRPSTADPAALAWRERPSDDLVLAVAVALEEAERVPPAQAVVVQVRRPSASSSEEGTPMQRHTIAVSLGPPSDTTGLAVVSTTWPGQKAEHAVRHLVRFPAGTAYADIRAELVRVAQVLEKPVVVVDATGVGKAIADGFPSDRRLVLTAGLADRDRVPRGDVAAALQMALQGGRLKIARGPLADELGRELRTFGPRPPTAAPADSLSWRERPSDDLTLAVGIAVWTAENESGWLALARQHRAAGSPAPGTQRLPPAPDFLEARSTAVIAAGLAALDRWRR